MKQMSPQEAYHALQGKGERAVIDVRTPEEFVRGHIEGSINIPLDQLAQQASLQLPDKAKAIFIYCFSGSRSIAGAQILDQLGYNSVYNIQNGVLGWRMSGYPLI